MNGVVFEGGRVSGDSESVHELGIKLTRLAALEYLLKSVPGYPSVITMEEHIRALRSSDQKGQNEKG